MNAKILIMYIYTFYENRT